MKYDYHIIVIGAGSGGLVVASGAAALGAKVALIESEKMGGDCLNSGCVPSKSFLKGAHLAKDIRGSDTFGIHTEIKAISIEALMNRVHSVIAEIEPHDSVERYQSLGVTVLHGKGMLKDPHTVQVNNKTITGKYIVISTGSAPLVPPIPGLDTVPYLTNRTIFNMKKQPKHLIVLGAGPIGLELGQGFRHLGSEVTIIDQNSGLFGKDDPEVGPIMEKVFLNDGIELKLSAKIISVQQEGENILVTLEKDGIRHAIIGDGLLVSLGRIPVNKDLGLEAVGVKLSDRGYIVTNEQLQSSVKNIYACGDSTGPYQFTHMAGYQAGLVIKNSIFRLGAKLNYSAVPWTTYTKPEVAHVGQTEPTAVTKGVFGKSILIPLNEIDRAKAENDIHGFLKVILDRGNRIIGATLVGDKAGEMIPVATLAIRQKLKVSAFLNMIFSYPTEAEIFKMAALKSMKEEFKPWQGKLIKAIFLKA